MSVAWLASNGSLFDSQSNRRLSRLGSSMSSSSRSGRSSAASSVTSLANSVHSNDLDTQEDWRVFLTAKLFAKPLENRFLCASCLRVIQNPVSLSQCDHHVCSGCVGELCRRKKICCPIDGKRFVRNECIGDTNLENELNSLELECPHKLSGCSWTGVLENYKEHFESCTHTEVQCSNGCRYRTTKRLIDIHLTSECPLRQIICEFCQRSLKAQNEIEHLKDCPKLPVPCPKSCGQTHIPREELNEHLSSDCSKAEILCPYYNLGCSFTGSKVSLTEHVQHSLNDHIKILCEAALTHKDLLAKHGGQLQEFEETVADHRDKLAILNRESETQLLWKIDNWGAKMNEAKSGKRPILNSVPFFTGKHQYKLALTLMPYGDKGAKGRFMSLYVRVCKGEYDTLLPWPFAMGIDLILIDQSQDPKGRTDYTHTLRPNPCKDNLPFLGKPSAESNAAFGIQNFFSLDLLSTRDYVRDNVVFIRVCVKRKKML